MLIGVLDHNPPAHPNPMIDGLKERADQMFGEEPDEINAGIEPAENVLAFLVAIGATFVARNALRAGWRTALNRDPPKIPASHEVNWRDALLWGALAILNDLHKDSSPAINLPAIRVIFQPEEETSRGGLHMIEAGALAGVSAAVALHVDPTRPVGTIGIQEGALTAGCDLFECEIKGDGGHGARPHLTSDTIGAAAPWVTEICRRAPRMTDARDAVVVNVGQVNSGAAPNVVPSTATLTGTLRTLTSKSSERAKDIMRDISESIASAHSCAVKLRFDSTLHLSSMIV